MAGARIAGVLLISASVFVSISILLVSQFIHQRDGEGQRVFSVVSVSQRDELGNAVSVGEGLLAGLKESATGKDLMLM